MFTLQNFERHIGTTVLQRAKKYYDNGFVVSIEETSKGTWMAEVEGSETYSVKITFTQGYEVTGYSCDCPFDGGICKHVTAVLFALQNEVKKVDISPKVVSKKEVFDSMLQSLTKKEHQDFIRSYAAGNKDFKTAFELFFAHKDSRIDVQKKYSESVRKLIQKHTRRGYVDYRESFGLSKELDHLISTGLDYVSKNNYRDAFALATGILPPVMKVLTNSDDSSGRIGDSIDNIVELLETIATAADAATDIKQQIFAFLQVELKNKDYFDYGDFGYSLCNVFQGLAIQLNNPGIFLTYIDSEIHNFPDKQDSYHKEYFQKEKIAFLQQIGRSDEAEKLVRQNIDIVDIRVGAINQAIRKKDLATAKKLIAEGIKIAKDKGHPGTVAQWQKELLRIAMLEKDTATTRQYTKYFAFDRGFSAEYYKQWKGTFTKAEWQIEIEKYIEQTIKKITGEWSSNSNKYWKSAALPLLQSLAPVYIEENFLDGLLALVQQESGLRTILLYHPYLKRDYPNELLAIYPPALEAYAMECNSRSEYADLVHKMKIIVKDLPDGKEQILLIARRLVEKFSNKPRRPAMIEELRKML